MRNRVIDSRQIAAFAALVKRGRFTLAAEDLFLTQSAVSHAIKSLEEDLGCRLFERSGRKIVLTPAGERLRLRSETILSEMRAVRLEIEGLSGGDRGQLCAGAGTLACQYILPGVLREFKRAHPQCAVRLESGSLPDLLQLLRAREIDFALGIDGARSDEFAFEPLFEDELLFFVSGQHPWARAGRVPKASIADEIFVVPLKSGTTAAMLDGYFRSEKAAPKAVFAPGSLDAAKELVASGFGVGLFARWQVAAEPGGAPLVAVPLTSKRLVRKWTVSRLKGRELSPMDRDFIERCRSAFQALEGRAAPRPAR